MELDEEQVTKPHSKIISKKVVAAAKEAGGQDNKPCIIFCLLVCKRWFKHQSMTDLWDADLYALRATACEVIAKQMYVCNATPFMKLPS